MTKAPADALLLPLCVCVCYALVHGCVVVFDDRYGTLNISVIYRSVAHCYESTAIMTLSVWLGDVFMARECIYEKLQMCAIRKNRKI